MTFNRPTLPTTAMRTRDLAKVIDAHTAGFAVQFLDDRSITNARMSDSMQQRGIVIRPGHLVIVVTRGVDPTADSFPYEVVWRGPAVVTVTSIEGDRVTYDTGLHPNRAVCKSLHDARPEDERQAFQTGQQIVVDPIQDNPEAVSLVDLAANGLPLHPDRLRVDALDRAKRAARLTHGVRAPTESGVVDHDDPRRIVAEGYDRMAERYARWVGDGLVDEVRPRYAAQILEQVPAGAHVLELGCGGGGPTTRQLAARFALTGIDISARQIELARANVPHAEFIHSDMSRAEFPPASFDGVAAFYSFLHLPHGELPQLIHRIGSWLRPNGLLVATMAAGPDPGTIEPEFLGVPMYFSGYAIEDNRQFLEEAGLEVVTLQHETIVEDGRPVGFLWAVARKQARDG